MLGLFSCSRTHGGTGWAENIGLRGAGGSDDMDRFDFYWFGQCRRRAWLGRYGRRDFLHFHYKETENKNVRTDCTKVFTSTKIFDINTILRYYHLTLKTFHKNCT